ncbi:hypothetical protein EGW08_005572 [Elysia chlorotica]|uniref:Uncharacterized protein n=1 Tax=Elysia chlorotica TaxID=188477 RepID=A0A3S1BLZ5_ELYCH|nr:hypothetical protein EGW08_005572 [Elysia chlorotica]
MCYIPDGTLVLYDDKYVWRADPFSGHVKKVVQVDSVASMTGCSDGVLFVKNKSVYLIGRDTDKVQLVLSLAGRLKKEDKLLHISAQGNICVCYTQFGFMLVFDITR